MLLSMTNYVSICKYWSICIYISSVQSLSRVWLFATPWIAAHQASLSITISRSSLKFMSYRGLECKSRSQETPGVTGKFGLGIWNEAWQRLIEFCQENTLVIANTLFQQHKRRIYRWTSPDGQHWNQLIIFFAAKDGEALYRQQKQDRELTVAQIMNSLLPNSDLNALRYIKCSEECLSCRKPYNMLGIIIIM